MKRRFQRPEKKRRGPKPSAKKYKGPRTLAEFLAMPEDKRDIHTRATQAITYMRTEHASVPAAARELGLPESALRRIGDPAMRKGENGRYTAKPSDHLLRPLLVLTPKGPREIGVRDSRIATLVAEHWNVAHRFLESGDKSVRKFRGKSFIDADGKKIRLMTNLKELERRGHAGVLRLESIYPK